jgi:RNA polymerase sigma-70 factor (ECF subfamily)
MSQRGSFRTTVWTIVHHAKKKDRQAVEKLLAVYRPPILNYLIGEGVKLQDAEGLANEVLERMSREAFYKSVDTGKGRFRSLVKSVTKRVMRDHVRIQTAEKRGGGRKLLSLDRLRDEHRQYEPAAKADPEPEFDRPWVVNYVMRALNRYRDYCSERGRKTYALFELYVLHGKCQEEVAASQGCKVHDVKNAVRRARLKIAEYLHEQIRSDAPDHFSEEMQYLAQYLPDYLQNSG